ncbi:hypothetical protein G6F65_020199 [Rhizopus arrhizus]|nr:hypothetical protein G6F65_020199 [Rhizopus arrhizus]
MLGVIDLLEGRRILDDAGHPDAADLLPQRLASSRVALEHDLAGAIRLAVRTHDAVGVGHVAGRHVHALRLRAERRTGDIENAQQGHCLSLPL